MIGGVVSGVIRPPARGLTRNTGVGAWTPANLGAALYDMWDAERADLISLSGSAVTAWASVKNGYSAGQAVGASRPLYSLTSFNGRPGITFDGSDDFLSYDGVGVFPTGATACEIWALTDQAALAADAVARLPIAYGGLGTLLSRRLQRISNAGTNRARVVTGDGSTGIAAIQSSVDFSGRHAVRGIVGEANTDIAVDGTAGTPAAVVPATGTVRTRIGADTNTTPGGYWLGTHSLIAITAPLDATQAAQMLAYLKTRGGIS